MDPAGSRQRKNRRQTDPEMGTGRRKGIHDPVLRRRQGIHGSLPENRRKTERLRNHPDFSPENPLYPHSGHQTRHNIRLTPSGKWKPTKSNSSANESEEKAAGFRRLFSLFSDECLSDGKSGYSAMLSSFSPKRSSRTGRIRRTVRKLGIVHRQIHRKNPRYPAPSPNAAPNRANPS